MLSGKRRPAMPKNSQVMTERNVEDDDLLQRSTKKSKTLQTENTITEEAMEGVELQAEGGKTPEKLSFAESVIGKKEDTTKHEEIVSDDEYDEEDPEAPAIKLIGGQDSDEKTVEAIRYRKSSSAGGFNNMTRAANAIEGELKATLLDLQWAWDKGVKRIRLFSDSKQVVEWINGYELPDEPCEHLVINCKKWIKKS